MRCRGACIILSDMKDTPFTVRLTKEEKEQAVKKAGDIPLSLIVRKLIQMWINGEIEIKI